MIYKKTQLDKINIYWQKNCKCELKKTATRAVFGSGNILSDIVFIGEAPGKKEDSEGKPFVGASGKFLNEMLISIKKNRDDIYITNIVKYRPPNNRDPNKDEKYDCIPWLIDELKIIRPKLIIFLGRHSMLQFFPKEKIGDIHGKLLFKDIPDLGNQAFMPLYHPAAALYNGGMRATLIKDFKKIPRVLKKISNKLN